MLDNFSYLYTYLFNEGIYIDKDEFEFQLKSHPDYPTLLAIADTLTSLDVQNNAVKIDFEKLDLLPKTFIANIKKNDFDTQLCFIEQQAGKYYTTSDKKTLISREDLKEKWTGIIFIVETKKTESPINNKYTLTRYLLLGLLVSILVLLWQFDASLQSLIFLVFSVVGIFLSVAALKDLFGVKSSIINNICNLSTSVSCSSILNSNKWKIFNIINFSDLSICFFSAQFCSLLLFLLTNNIDQFFTIQQLLLFVSVPVVIISLYFQKFVEKKWCPICLAIIFVIVLELLLISYYLNFNFVITSNAIIQYTLTFFSISLLWATLKRILTSNQNLKEFQLEANRFTRNYSNFKTILTSTDKVNLPSSAIILGSPTCATVLTVITNPFCSHCRSIHEILNKILDKNGDQIQINIIIKVKLDEESDENKLFYNSLFSVFLTQGAIAFNKALHDWFSIKNVALWLRKYSVEKFDSQKIHEIYKLHFEWCNDNMFHFTPALFVNGYLYPNSYNRNNLPYYIEELIEDQDFYHQHE